MQTNINTVADLNKFVVSRDIRSPDKIIAHLADKKLIISNEMARLILDRALQQPEQIHQ